MAPTKKLDEGEGSNEKPKPVEPVKLAPMTGVGAYREQVKTNLRRAVPLALLATGAGFGSGKYVQGKYRDFFDYDPSNTVEEASASPDSADDEPEDDLDDVDDESRGYWEKTRRAGKKLLQRAKKATSDNVVTRTYRDWERTGKVFIQKCLKFGDTVVFWGTFMTMTLVFYWLSRNIQAAYLRRFQPHDPVVVRNFDALAKKTEELGKVANYLMARGAPQDPVAARADLDDLKRRVEEIEGALREPAQALEAEATTEPPQPPPESSTGTEPGKA